MSNMDVIEGMYEAFATGDMARVLGVMDPAIEWNEAEHFPYADGNPYVGPEAILNGVFMRIGAEWDYWNLHIEHRLDAGDAVVVLGRYRGKRRDTGTALDAQFAHILWLKNGKVIRFQQYADTAQAMRVVGG